MVCKSVYKKNRYKNIFIPFVICLSFFFSDTRTTLADAMLDKLYALETIGFLKTWDNVDGLFSEYVANAYEDYLSKNTRFRLVDLSKASQVVSRSSIPYQEAIKEPKILQEIARKFQVESIILTKVLKEGDRYRFELKWLQSTKAHTISEDSFFLDEPKEGQILEADDIRFEIENALVRMINRLPFVGHVNGRDNDWITVNMGRNSKIKKGDTLIIGTLQEVKTHPLLRTIVDWKTAETGRVTVDEVDDGIAFCQISEEEPKGQIVRFQKVLKVIPSLDPIQKGTISGNADEKESSKNPFIKPHLGWFSMGPTLGSFQRQFTKTGATGISGSGFLIGANAAGKLWLNKMFFLQADFNLGSANYSDTAAGSASTGTSSSSMSLLGFKMSAGYNYLLTQSFFGPKGWIRFGYGTSQYTLPISTTNGSAPTTFSGLFFGLGGELPLRDKYGVDLSIDIGIANSTALSSLDIGAADGTSNVNFYLGGFYRLMPVLSVTAGMIFINQTYDALPSGGASTANITNKILGASTSIRYYF